MATKTTSGWAAAASVSAFLSSSWPPSDALSPPPPSGAPVETDTADASGRVTFSALADGTNYVATDGARVVSFRTDDVSQGPAGSSAPVIVAGGNLGATRSETLPANVEEWLTGTLNANHTLTLTLAAGARLRLFGSQDATGGRTLTVSDGTTPQAVGIPAGANDTFEVDCYSPDGTTIYVNTGGSGADGRTVLTTTDAPATAVGNDGDYAYDPAAKVMYGPKASTWPAGVSLQGPPGTNGTNGAISGVQDEGTDLAVRAKLNFAGAGVTATDDSAGGRTLITIPGGGGGGLTDLSVLARYLTDLARFGTRLPAGAIAANARPQEVTVATIALVSGTLRRAGGCVLPGGRAVTSVSFMSGATAGASLTHAWFAIVDKTGNVLATTLDDTSASWAANTAKTLQLATALGGSTAGTYTPANDIDVDLAVCVVGATPPSMTGAGPASAVVASSGLGGNSSAGLTTPGSLGTTAAAATASGNLPWGWVS